MGVAAPRHNNLMNIDLLCDMLSTLLSLEANPIQSCPLLSPANSYQIPLQSDINFVFESKYQSLEWFPTGDLSIAVLRMVITQAEGP